MRRSVRLLIATTLTGAGMLAVAPAAHAVVDPVVIAECLSTSAGDITHLVDPAAPGVPAELPATHCLAP
ncbi:hypothetical protein MF672_004130 [Actinomadura sp. ATCC 31491]|uniref:Secreted protein n=1 Tax=Actinomadura luzonensis TaxID=2805427 RepID=A0ABT0FM02_9ACTN|nr:hypothetical protein [Actinomadura luzonensis]MCK2212986.1 hypothetical protein [Actinomadura luzonensis]